MKKLQEKNMINVGDVVKVVVSQERINGICITNIKTGHIGVVKRIYNSYTTPIGVNTGNGKGEDDLWWFAEKDIEKIELPTEEEVMIAAKTDDEAALEISILKWSILSVMPNEQLKKLQFGRIHGNSCGLCMRKAVLHEDCTEPNCILGNCAEGSLWSACHGRFELKDWEEFRKLSKKMVEKLKTGRKKGKQMDVDKVKERLEQNRADVKKLEGEGKRLEAELEKSKTPKHGDFGYHHRREEYPIVYLKVEGEIKAFDTRKLDGGWQNWKTEIVGNIFKGDKI